MTVKVDYHKAEVVVRDGRTMITKQCHSWRAEAQLWKGEVKVATMYKGMGSQANHPETHPWVIFGQRMSVALACVAEPLRKVAVREEPDSVIRSAIPACSRTLTDLGLTLSIATHPSAAPAPSLAQGLNCKQERLTKAKLFHLEVIIQLIRCETSN